MENEMLEQNKQEKPVSLLTKALLTGFVGGVLWSMLGALAAYFNFTSVSPASFILRSWLQTGWSDSWLGQLISIFVIGVISVLLAIVYYGLFRKMKSIWPSAIFGVGLWFIVYFLLQPIFPNVPQMAELSMDTVVTTICLFLLYGIFVGYSISYDYLDSVTKKNV
ncbi:YqhR family membrane protein [Aquibacillus koreensis]|uniref:YqhR family membrane protein n=1 Tax=Aquibacillus koreensis TaxID=279446 RepID=A0A9X3WHA5_9BACI|nr:YqhR family membrane protein [Aquibacillus koreensis]MCT2537532.1 YqhR family membrane protein [Aquibacillus koreensis]MDC3418978.1 YqhR family membrane protein [Aquibacillus koreensis]